MPVLPHSSKPLAAERPLALRRLWGWEDAIERTATLPVGHGSRRKRGNDDLSRRGALYKRLECDPAVCLLFREGADLRDSRSLFQALVPEQRGLRRIGVDSLSAITWTATSPPAPVCASCGSTSTTSVLEFRRDLVLQALAAQRALEFGHTLAAPRRGVVGSAPPWRVTHPRRQRPSARPLARTRQRPPAGNIRPRRYPRARR